jgi:putative PIN family toxin of toxin-antitoxin system
MKKVLFDTNILVSAILDNRSTTYQAYSKGVEPPYQGLICEQVFEELRRVFNRKFPNKIAALERFIASALSIVEVVPVPPSKYPDEDLIRDIDDRPILRTAIKAEAEILITGDKDFLESGLTAPRIMTAAEFLKMP